MAATSQGIVAASALQGRVAAKLSRSRSSKWSSSSGSRFRGLVMPASKSFRAFRMIKKSPRLSRSASRKFKRMGAAAMLGDNHFVSKDLQVDDVMRKFENDDDDAAGMDETTDSSPAIVDTVNEVLADIVDAQQYSKEIGRTKARPMKRRALVVSLALSALRDPLNSVDSRLGSLRRAPSSTRLSRTPSASGFARTTQLISQLSFGSPGGAEVH